MKRLCLLLALCGVFAVGCGEFDFHLDGSGNLGEKPNNGGNENKNEVVFDVEGESGITVDVDAVGGTVEVKLSTNIDYSVVIAEDAQGWVSVAESRADVREEVVTLVVATNVESKVRTAAIAFKDGDGKELHTLTIRQAGAVEEHIFTVDGDATITVAAEGCDVSVKVITDIEYQAVISEDAQSWVTIVESRAELREEYVTFAVAANEATVSREATILFNNAEGHAIHTLTIVQQAAEEKPYFTLEGDTEFSFETDGGSAEVLIATNIEYQVVIPEVAKSWLSVVVSGADKATFAVAANTTYDRRSADVKFVDAEGVVLGTVTFSQQGLVVENPVFDFGHVDNYIVEREGGNIMIAISTNIEYNVVIPEEVQSWLSLAQTRGEVVSEVLTFVVAANSGEERSAEVSFTDASNSLLQSFTITQKGVNKNGNIVFADEDVKAVCVKNYDVDGDGEVSYQEAEWVTYIPKYFFSGGSNYSASYYDKFNTFDELQYFTNVVVIHDYAFYNCSKLTSITLPEGLLSIGYYAFYNCKGLTTFTLPKSVNYISKDAFYQSENIKRVYISDLAAWCNIKFENAYANPMYNGANLFVNNEFVSELTIPSGVTAINSFAFWACESLKSVTIPEGVTSIGKSSFNKCVSLSNVTLPNSLTTIGSYSFDECDALRSITIPEGVTSIGDYAFYDCSGLTSVYCKAATPPTLNGTSHFAANASSRKIYVPTASVDTYKAAAGWSGYKSSIVGYDF